MLPLRIDPFLARGHRSIMHRMSRRLGCGNQKAVRGAAEGGHNGRACREEGVLGGDGHWQGGNDGVRASNAPFADHCHAPSSLSSSCLRLFFSPSFPHFLSPSLFYSFPYHISSFPSLIPSLPLSLSLSFSLSLFPLSSPFTPSLFSAHAFSPRDAAT